MCLICIKAHCCLNDVPVLKVKVTLVQALRLCTGRTAIGGVEL